MVLGSSPVAVTIHVRFCIRIDISISIRPIITKLNHIIFIPSVYTHQTWQVGNLPWRAPVYKVTWLFNHVVLQDHLTWKASIYKVTWPFDHVVLQDHLTWQIKLLCLHCQSAYGDQNLHDGNLPCWASAHKVTWPSDDLIH